MEFFNDYSSLYKHRNWVNEPQRGNRRQCVQSILTFKCYLKELAKPEAEWWNNPYTMEKISEDPPTTSGMDFSVSLHKNICIFL